VVQGSHKTLRIAKKAAAVAAAVAMKKEQRLPCPKGKSQPISQICKQYAVLTVLWLLKIISHFDHGVPFS